MIVARFAAVFAVAMPLALAAFHRPAERTVRGYYDDGRPSYERHYVNGREDGLEIGWWEDGSVRFVFHYTKGLMEGPAREWYLGGRLYRSVAYRHGQEEGLQRMWWPDGTLRASYVVRDGRRYGLLGAKGCIQTDTAEASQ